MKKAAPKKYLESNKIIIFVTVCARMVFFPSQQKATKGLIGHAPFLSGISGSLISLLLHGQNTEQDCYF